MNWRTFGLGLVLVLPAVHAALAGPAITLDSVWTDTAGNEIAAQGGCVVQVGKVFYWYGVEYDGQQPKRVRCYSSTDLAAWKSEKTVLDEHVSRRVKVLAGPAGNRFVMFTREGTRMGVFVATAPTGPFQHRGEVDLPQAVGPGDVNAFLDDDGKAYVIYCTADPEATGKSPVVIAELGADWLTVARVVYRFKEAAVDTPALWKHSGVYYCTASRPARWYAASDVSYSSAASLAGQWAGWRPLQQVQAGGNSRHNTVFEVRGTQDRFLVYMGDRYTQFTDFGIGKQVWLPLFFNGDTPTLIWCRPWYPDVQRGTFMHDLRRYGLWREPKKQRVQP